MVFWQLENKYYLDIVANFILEFLKIDLNDLVFNQTLHMVENASQYKASGLVSTGLCWNAGGIAAAIILVAAFAGSQWKVVALIIEYLNTK